MSDWMSPVAPFRALNDTHNPQFSTNTVTCFDPNNKLKYKNSVHEDVKEPDTSNNDCEDSSGLTSDEQESSENVSNVCDGQNNTSQDNFYSFHKDSLNLVIITATANSTDSDNGDMSGVDCRNTEEISATNKLTHNPISGGNVQSRSESHKPNVVVAGANYLKDDYKRILGTRELIIKLRAIPTGVSSVTKLCRNDAEYDQNGSQNSHETLPSQKQKSTGHATSVRKYDSSTESGSDDHASSKEKANHAKSSTLRMKSHTPKEQVHVNISSEIADSMFFDDESECSTEDDSMKHTIRNVINRINDHDHTETFAISPTSTSIVSSNTPISITSSLLNLRSDKRHDFNSEFLKGINSVKEVQQKLSHDTSSRDITAEDVDYVRSITETPYRCMTCGARFGYKSTLDLHSSSHDGEGSQVCPECGKIFFLAVSLKIHLCFHNERAISHNCETCGKSFSSFSNLRHHRRVNHKTLFTCNICKSQFKYKQHLHDHRFTHTGEKPYRCHVCAREFRFQSNLITHSKGHLEKKPFVCNVCNAGFIRHAYLHRHLETHLAESLRFGQLKDILKGKINNSSKSSTINGSVLPDAANNIVYAEDNGAAKNSNQLSSFVIDTTPMVKARNSTSTAALMNENAKEINQLCCPVCEKVIEFNQNPACIRSVSNKIHSVSTYGYKYHLQNRSSDRSFKCDICQQCFRQSKALCRHKLIHSDVKPYVCPICKVGFRRKTNLQTHIINHGTLRVDGQDLRMHVNQAVIAKSKRMRSGQPPSYIGDENESTTENTKKIITISNILSTNNALSIMECEYCKKAFMYKIHFDAHMRTHTGERPYCCKTCGKGFTQQANLGKHQRIHTGDKPFVCPICKKTFTQKQNMQKHQRIHTIEISFACPVCGRVYLQKKYMKRHQKIHNNKLKQFSCSICGKNFIYKQNIKEHEKAHNKSSRTKKKPRKNTNVGQKKHAKAHKKSLHRKTKNVRHKENRWSTESRKKTKISHSTLTPTHDHNLSLRDRSFPNIFDLSSHMLSHNLEKVFSCKHCTKTYKHSRTLAMHMKKHRGLINLRNYRAAKLSNDTDVPNSNGAQMKHIVTGNLSANETEPFPVLGFEVEPLTVQNEEIEHAVYSNLEIDNNYLNQETGHVLVSCREDIEVQDSEIIVDISVNKDVAAHIDIAFDKDYMNKESENDPDNIGEDVLCFKVHPLIVQDEEIEPAVYNDIALDTYYLNQDVGNGQDNNRDVEVQDSKISVCSSVNGDITETIMNDENECVDLHVCVASPSGAYNLGQLNTKPSAFTCLACNLSFPNFEQLADHVTSHKTDNITRHKTNEAPFICMECGIHFNAVEALNAHRQQHSESVLDCTLCGERFRLISELQDHITKHMSNNPYIAFNLQAMYLANN